MFSYTELSRMNEKEITTVRDILEDIKFASQ